LRFVNNGTVFVAAVGNDGPYFGSINTPADMLEVISVGGLGIEENFVSSTSSRGMTR
jgi:subtilisin family serine protease